MIGMGWIIWMVSLDFGHPPCGSESPEPTDAAGGAQGEIRGSCWSRGRLRTDAAAAEPQRRRRHPPSGSSFRTGSSPRPLPPDPPGGLHEEIHPNRTCKITLFNQLIRLENTIKGFPEANHVIIPEAGAIAL